MLTYTINSLIKHDLIKKDLKESYEFEAKEGFYNKYLSPLGRIRMTHVNLAEIIKDVFRIDHNERMDYDHKLKSIYEDMLRTLSISLSS